MDKDQILSMQPGRKLDELIAENVMGIPVTKKRSRFEYVHIPPYSTNILATWKVVEKFHEITTKRYETMKDHRYWCKIELSYDGEPIIAQGETAPEAICKAALLAAIEPTESA